MKKLGKVTLLIGGLVATALPAAAFELSPSEALQMALIQSSGVAQGLHAPVNRDLNSYTLTKTFETADMNTMYLFAGAADRGYMLVAADDAVGQVLLGFSEEGRIDLDNMPDNLKWFLECASRRVAARAAEERNSEPLYIFGAPRRDVAPICKTKWDQSAPYWNDCPLEKGQRTYTGCAATALAQVMKAHNWPERGVGSITYNSASTGMVSVNFAESVYDWDNMLDVYTSSATAEQNAAVAKLMFDCGAAVKMQYGAEGSGAISPDIASALVNYFQYDRGTRIVNRECYTYGQFVDLLYNEVAAGCPVIMGGANWMNGAYYGHAFVIDGFRANGEYFHLNWGWSGMSDGYFLVNALDPESQGAGGSAAGYNLNSTAIIGVKPDRDGKSESVPNLFCNTPLVTKGATYQRTKGVNVDFLTGGNGRGVFNFTSYPSPILVRPGVKLVNEETAKEMYLTTAQTYQMTYQTGFTTFPIDASKFPNDGNWYVTLGYEVGTKWYDLAMDIAVNKTLMLEASNTTLSFRPLNDVATLETVEFNLPEDAYLNTPFHISAKVKAKGGEFYSRLALVILSSTGSTVLSQLDLMQGDVLEGEEKEFNWYPTFSTNGGFRATTYKVALCNVVNNGYQQLPGASGSITLAAAPKTEFTATGVKINNTISSASGSSAFAPAICSLDNFSADVTISTSTGYFADMISMVVFNRAGTQEMAETPRVFAEVGAGESETFTMKSNLVGALQANTIYLVVPFGLTHGQLTTDMRYIKATAAGIEEVGADAASEVMVGVNPADAILTVSAPAEIRLVEVYAVSGVKVAQAAGHDENLTLDLAQAAPGYYVVRVQLADGTIVNRQIIKR